MKLKAWCLHYMVILQWPTIFDSLFSAKMEAWFNISEKYSSTYHTIIRKTKKKTFSTFFFTGATSKVDQEICPSYYFSCFTNCQLSFNRLKLYSSKNRMRWLNTEYIAQFQSYVSRTSTEFPFRPLWLNFPWFDLFLGSEPAFKQSFQTFSTILHNDVHHHFLGLDVLRPCCQFWLLPSHGLCHFDSWTRGNLWELLIKGLVNPQLNFIWGRIHDN